MWDPGIVVPLACFAAAVLIVALIAVAKVRDREMETFETLGRAEALHRSRLSELDLELQQLKREDLKRGD